MTKKRNFGSNKHDMAKLRARKLFSLVFLLFARRVQFKRRKVFFFFGKLRSSSWFWNSKVSVVPQLRKVFVTLGLLQRPWMLKHLRNLFSMHSKLPAKILLSKAIRKHLVEAKLFLFHTEKIPPKMFQTDFLNKSFWPT